jgi:hypothetical protein
MWKYLSILSALSLVTFGYPQQEQKQEAQAPAAEFKVPADAAKLANPVKPTADSIAQGKKIYGCDCAMCHGVDGDGKGDLAANMKLKVPDFRDPEIAPPVSPAVLAQLFRFPKTTSKPLQIRSWNGKIMAFVTHVARMRIWILERFWS